MTELLVHPDAPPDKRIAKLDRRISNFKSILQSFYKGRRRRARRKNERDEEADRRGFYTDQYENWVGLSVLIIILLSSLDSLFTLTIIKNGGVEENPFMLALLEIDNLTFLIVKMSMTVICMLFIFVHSNFYVLKVIPVKLILKGILLLYTALIGYELFLLSII